MQTIYIDVLIGVNIYVNYLLLVLTARFAGCRIERTRIALAALIGALSSCTILLKIQIVALSIFIKTATAAIMTAVAFPVRSLRSFAKQTLILATVTFAFAGVMLGIKNFISADKISVSNFSVYLDISPLYLIFATLVCYVVLSVYFQITARRTQRQTTCKVTISSGGKSVTLDGLIDTGNTLTEPFSGLPVVVVSEKSVHDILPEEVKRFDLSEPHATASIRLIPYSSVGGSGLLTGFMPDSIKVEREGQERESKDVYIAVADKEREIPVIINPDILL